jgi:tetratricopeptide (TPR) repeat protein
MDIADKYKYRGGTEEGVVWFQKVIDSGEPLDSLTGEARMALADDLRRAEKYDESIAAFAEIQEDFGTGYFADDAEIWIAIVHRQNDNKDEALKRFQAYIETHDSSGNVDYCLSQIEKLTAPPDTVVAEE